MCISIRLHVCMCTMHVWCVHAGQKKPKGVWFSELNLKIIVSHHVYAGSWTQLVSKTISWSLTLNSLFFPYAKFYVAIQTS